MNETNSFESFPKIARLNRECVITEKIDGTNAQIYVADSVGEENKDVPFFKVDKTASGGGCLWIAAGSRNRWITPEADNYGFARWVRDNAEHLVHLGPGRHFGEWWGNGIQRGYGLKEKRFSLFNTARWKPAPDNGGIFFDQTVILLPGLSVVPILSYGLFNTLIIEYLLNMLRGEGSVAAPGFMNPEGIVIWHEAARVLFKKTIIGDAQPKGKT